MRFGFYETCFDIGLLASPLCGAAVTFFAQACRWRFGFGVFEPFDALRLSLPPKNEFLAERLNSSKESQEDEQDEAGAL
ncbi:hypothetical protein, partial [Caballeronia glathei]